MMRTANPALNANTFKRYDQSARSEGAMTINGTVHKTAILVLLALISASYVWRQFFAMGLEAVNGMIAIGAIGGFVIALVTFYKKHWAGITAPVYAVLEGLFLGGTSAVFEARFPGIVIQSVALTFGTLFALLFAYRSGFIKVTENFKLGVIAAGGGILLVYIATFILGIFGISIPLIHGSGPVGIGFSLFVVVIAAMFLVMDFDFIEQGAEMGAPKFMEWYAAFGLMVTLVWLYLEILRLLAKLQSRNR